VSLGFLFDTPEFKEILESVLSGDKGLRIAGITDAAKPYLLACLALKLGRRMVCVRPPSRDLSPLEKECRFFLGQFRSTLGTGVLPALSDDPYLEIPPSLEAVSSRMRFLHEARPGKPSLVLTNPFGLLKPIPCPEELERSFMKLEVGENADRDILLRTFAEYGYSREDIIASPGEYAWRGGIVDVFPPWQANPVRIEFAADTVASLREFDTGTQRSLRRLDRALVPSLREFPGTPEFLEDWVRLARKAGGEARADLEEKIRFLEGGEYLPSFVYLSLLAADRFVPFTRYLGDSVFILDDRDEIEREWVKAREELVSHHGELAGSRTFALPPGTIYPPSLWKAVSRDALVIQELVAEPDRKTVSFAFQPVPKFENKIGFFLEYLKKLQWERELCYVYLSNQGTRQRLATLLEESGIQAIESSDPLAVPKSGEISLLLGGLGEGFAYPRAKVIIFAERDIFTEEKVLVHRASRKPFFSQFQDLESGDLVVHTDYGVGIFHGLRRVEVDGRSREFIELLYRDGDKLLVPVEDLNLVQKFSKAGDAAPPLDKLGTITWQKTKARTRKAVEAIARELLELYALRKSVRGISFSPEGLWGTEFEKIFEHEETEDQLKSIREIIKDMESETPMDRLLCGDVGYGKTEVAMRAAFKAVMDGKQVAVLCPTTVLASQHLKTFKARMVLFPVSVEGLTRLQSRIEQKAVLGDVGKGFVDILVGTHRILSKDVVFKDLGLLIVDEEQRFGVSHKERIKGLRANIDVLTLTATPIPRTLNMSLTGLRDISLIETPPRDRLSVHTVVTPWNAKLVASAVRQELNRGGQVFYVHNRIEDIDRVARLVEKLVPQARVVTIHGQMSGAALEKRMMAFIAREYNVLVSTTIIENGIDIPLVNTLIVDRADLFGLAQLYQLRGRVGRSSRQATAYFLVPPLTELTPLARERLKALKEFSELGSGFRLAAKDLEIRGAGNLLGHRQSGTIEAVGYEYFMHLLDQAIREQKGEVVEEVKTEINLKADIRVPEDYLPQVNLRLNLYKRLSSIEDLGEIDRIRGEIRDRFGDLPASVGNLMRYGAIKFLAVRLRIESLDRAGDRLVFKFEPTTGVDLARVPALLKKHRGSMTPQGVMALTLGAAADADFLEATIGILKELTGYTTMN
jgi:transcription-repair coupling factor (superfamily II helicase)